MRVWTIWFRHNAIQVTPTSFLVDQVQQRAIDSLPEFQAAQPRKQPTPLRPLSKWSPPDEDYYKVNFYGIVFKEEKKVGIRVIIRNYHGM